MSPQQSRQLTKHLENAIRAYSPFDLLFVHRDAEREPREKRVLEIQTALNNLNIPYPPAVCVIPVRMQEAWLLFDGPAIRWAAGNPHGRMSLSLPPLKSLESLTDPKQTLDELLRVASGLPPRRKFDTRSAKIRLAEGIEDFAPLRALPAFQALEADLKAIVTQNEWANRP